MGLSRCVSFYSTAGLDQSVRQVDGSSRETKALSFMIRQVLKQAARMNSENKGMSGSEVCVAFSHAGCWNMLFIHTRHAWGDAGVYLKRPQLSYRE